MFCDKPRFKDFSEAVWLFSYLVSSAVSGFYYSVSSTLKCFSLIVLNIWSLVAEDNLVPDSSFLFAQLLCLSSDISHCQEDDGVIAQSVGTSSQQQPAGVRV